MAYCVSGCAEGKPPPDAGGQGQLTTPSEDISTTAAIFPHPNDWDTPAAHGSAAMQHGLAVCRQCHRSPPAGDNAPPECTACHTGYPHPEGWVQKKNHGAAAMAQNATACASACHGADLQGGLSGVACATCHAQYPHPPGWAEAKSHGPAAKGSAKLLCRGCHGANYAGGGSGVACTKCHAKYPHPTGWRQPENHGAFVAGAGSASCQTQCHGSDLRGGLSGVACETCHALYPHPETWEGEHGGVAKGVGLAACQGCHGTDYQTVVGGKHCYSCHADYPHPAQAFWLPFKGHGERVQVGYAGKTAACEGCHGADLKTVVGGKNCASCHPSYPHPQTAEVKWKDFAGHGAYTLGATKGECTMCHGVDFQGGERQNPSCFGCHAPYPHLAGWKQPQGHGTFVQANGSASCATAHCHGVNLMPQKDTTVGPDCTACHQTYPHPTGWNAGGVHGPIALGKGTQSCKECHGAGLDVAPAGYQSCKNCHPSYLRHKSAKLTLGWATYAGHGQYLLVPAGEKGAKLQECRLCHGADYLGGIANKSCKAACHPAYPHQGWQHAEYVKTALKGDPVACQLCHGADYQGGHAGVACSGCHEDFPHPAGWQSAEGHGKAFSQKYTSLSEDTGCAGCHGAPATFTQPIASKEALTNQSTCYTCHVAYPHKELIQDQLTLYPWTPMAVFDGVLNGQPCGRKINWASLAHILYVLSSPLFTDAAGKRPTDVQNDAPGWAAATQHTCGGGAAGSCHANGYRSLGLGDTFPACGSYCHGKTAPPVPAVPACPPPPPLPCDPTQEEC